MNRNFKSGIHQSSIHQRAGADRLCGFALIISFFFAYPAIFAQPHLLTREQFSRFSLLKRARVFEPAISRIAQEESIDPYLLWTIAYNETRFRPWLVSPAGAEGLMQFIPATAARFNLFDPYQPEPAIRAAARYVRFLSNRFGGQVDSILAGYNAGEGAVDAYLTGRTVRAGKRIINQSRIRTVGGVPPYQETVEYVARGLVIYRLLVNRRMFAGSFAGSVYPLAVSDRLARVWLRDPEIGFAGSVLTLPLRLPNTASATAAAAQNFSAASGQTNENSVRSNISSKVNDSLNRAVQQNNTAAPATPAATPAETLSTGSNNNSIKEKTDSIGSNEIYYDPRTGARFENRSGKMQRLTENGELVVIGGSRTAVAQPPAIRARGTFFGRTKASE